MLRYRNTKGAAIQDEQSLGNRVGNSQINERQTHLLAQDNQRPRRENANYPSRLSIGRIRQNSQVQQYPITIGCK